MTFDEQVAALRESTPPMQSRKRKADCTPAEWAAHLNYTKHRYHARSPEQKRKEAQAHQRWKEANRKRVNAINKRWVQRHAEQHRKACKDWLARNPGKTAEYSRRHRAKNPKRERARVRAYQAKHREKAREYQRKRRASSVAHRIRSALSCRMNQALRRALGGKAVKPSTTMQLVGCTVDELMRHLESLFLPGMSWDNWGRGKGKWHIDHVLPCAGTDMADPRKARAASHYTNLRPMWSHDNQSKGKRVDLADALSHFARLTT